MGGAVPELVNVFSWSFSAAEDFEDCRRKRYWGKYAMWGGWKETATPLQKAAYRLGKMDNRYSLLGNAVEESVMWVLRQKQAGVTATVDQAYETVTRAFLNKAWKESKTRMWQTDPRRHCNLREHYYGDLDPEAEKAVVTLIAEQTRRCIGNFIERVLPELEGVKPEQEVAIAKPGAGDPESFSIENVKIYAIPDYVYRTGEAFRIHDWKAGKPKERHKDQLTIYGLWANVKHRVPPEQVRVYIEYLANGEVESKQLEARDLEDAKARIAESVADMAEYLADGDIRRNEPLPQEEWELAVSLDSCRTCNFYELCKPEMAGE